MCGIFGSITKDPLNDFDAAFATIRSRGPDSSRIVDFQMGPWTAKFGHHRLAIIDLESGGQPLTKSPWTIVFNGEIYNYRALGKKLPPGTLQTTSDTEVILESFRNLQESAVSQLDGFFAFALAEHQSRELWLARDRWGIKPLYYSLDGHGGLIFASELKPFLKLQKGPLQLDLEGLDQYLFWDHIPGERTALKNVRKLKPGHLLHWKDGKMEIKPFFQPSLLLTYDQRVTTTNEAWERLTTAVDEAFIADVPVGILLSGGIDSSLLAVAARKRKGSGIPTFAIGFEDPDFDESPFAAQVAKHIQSDHHVRVIRESDLLDRWEGILDDLDEPLADPSILPTRLLAELARSKVKVVLGGDGGDELFGGYPTYRAHALRSLLDRSPDWLLSLGSEFAGALPTGSGYQPIGWKLKRLLNRYDRDPIRCHFRWMSGTDLETVQMLSRRSTDPIGVSYTLDTSNLNSFCWLDLNHYLPGSVLTKVDRATMAVGLEARPPFLTNAFVDYAFTVPAHQKVDARSTKKILREVAKIHLPANIVNRPKRGFAIPLAKWLRGPLSKNVQGMLKESPLWDHYDQKGAAQILEAQNTGQADHAKTLWALLALDRWLRH